MSETENLKGTAARGLAWSAVERFGSQGIQFVFGIVITRILLPSDYGLVGMILIFVAVGQTLIDSGFGSALIWKRDSTPADYSTVFYFNILISLILYLIVFLLAPTVSRFYDEPILVQLIRVLCLNFIILSFGLIQQVDLQKRIDFKMFALINIVAGIFSGIFAVYMAIKGAGVWAVVGQTLSKSFITTLMLWIFNSWRPIMTFNWLSLKELFHYGSKLTLASLIHTIFQNIYFNVIGKFFPLSVLGFYTRAVQLQEFPVKTLANVFSRVAFPIFTTIQDDNERFRQAVRKTLKTMVFVTFPVIIGLIAVADELIEVALTEKWLPAAGYFKLLCIMGLLYSFQIINGEILKTKGRSDWVLKLEIFTKLILVINIFVTLRWGITAIIIGQMISIAVAYFMGTFYVWKLIGYSIWQQIKDIFIYLIISLIMYGLVELTSLIFETNFTGLIAMTLSGTFFYFMAAYILKLEEFSELITGWRNMVKSRQK